MTGAAPILSIFLKLNSNPNVNSKMTTPIWAQMSMLPASRTEGIYTKWGPAMNPATM